MPGKSIEEKLAEMKNFMDLSIYLSSIYHLAIVYQSINQSTNQKGTDKKLECLTKWDEGGEKMENGVGRSEYRIMTEEFIAAMYEHKDEAC